MRQWSTSQRIANRCKVYTISTVTKYVSSPIRRKTFRRTGTGTTSSSGIKCPYRLFFSPNMFEECRTTFAELSYWSHHDALRGRLDRYSPARANESEAIHGRAIEILKACHNVILSFQLLLTGLRTRLQQSLKSTGNLSAMSIDRQGHGERR